MKTHRLLNFALALGVLCSLGAVAGDLEPGAPPASTMTTLDEISAEIVAAQDVRTPITSLPVTIEESGSYYLTGDLTLGELNTHGIVIFDGVDDVTIDFNGFAISGPGKAAGAEGTGVYAIADNVFIFNGTVRDFRGRGIYILGQNEQVSRMRIFNNGEDGIYFGTNGTVTDCNVRSNGGDGIHVGNGSVVSGNSVRGNGGNGIDLVSSSVVTGNAIIGNTGNGVDGDASLVVDNVITNNGAATNLTGSTVVDNHAP